jgi:hypothetical protein
MSSTPAIIGTWYQDKEQNLWFEVVALDDNEGTVEVQYIDGSISEIDAENWKQLPLVQAAAPEDSDAAYELSNEDRWNEEETLTPMSQYNPLEFLEPDIFPSIEDF